MALIVEDGTGLSGADSYISVADATAYHDARNNPAWAAAAANVREAGLRYAAQYVDGNYGRRFAGYKGSREQALVWPRRGAVDADGYLIPDNSIPRKLKQAAAELALAYVENTDLNPVLGQTVREEQIGPIRTLYEPGGNVRPQVTAALDLLRPLLARGRGVKLVRA